MNAHDPLSLATQLQHRASDPKVSAWVSANAGSGKTHVLVQRVIRLLLDGVPPSRILALTYTKAAAANMANRVFDTLGSWVTLDDAALGEKLYDVDHTRPSTERLRLARRLFARAVETPGGLKIQTIHAFCERLLQLFPFEANVAARFEVLDDATKAVLEFDARNGLLTDAAQGRDPELREALDLVTGLCGEDALDKLLHEAMRLKPLLRRIGGDRETLDDLTARLAEGLGLAPGETTATVDAELERGAFTPNEYQAAVATLVSVGGTNNEKRAQSLKSALVAIGTPAWRDAYESVFLTEKGKAFADSGFFTGKAKTSAFAPRAFAERERVAGLHQRRRAAAAVERTRALLIVADSALGRYETAKAARGALDFDDLIERTNALLSRSDAAWVLFKLDKGIDHLLVDEAQDTSPEQWEILRALTSEFFAGAGARAGRRTVFAVGDPKQSIYSFQGAEPGAFAESRRHFEKLANDAVEAGSEGFVPVSLNMSFRSAPLVLSAVDDVFASPEAHRGLSDDLDKPVHTPRDAKLPGLVELRPVVTKEEEEEPREWTLAPDALTRSSPAVRVASDIAGLIAGWLRPDSPERILDVDPADRKTKVLRPIRAGDVTILVRSRNAFFEAVIRQLKEKRVPVAGADKLALTAHIAVMDLMALGRAALLPEDDLSLAELLKSPLFGMDDDDLMRLAPARTRSLHAALAASPADAEAFARFERWRAAARATGPFAFYSAVLGADEGRATLLARLGPEAGDAVDEFLKLALDHEHQGPPSLQRFLSELSAADIKVKRDMEAGRDEVRVMTVHGAKGLEAPIVLLPDTCGTPDKGRAGAIQTIPAAPGADFATLPVWSISEAVDAEMVDGAKRAEVERQMEEHRRLLYVALTRAKERLYVFGHVGVNKPSKGCWYELIEAGLDGTLEPVTDGSAPDGTKRRVVPAEGVPDAKIVSRAAATSDVAPDWLRRPAAAEPPAAPPLSPSTALAAADGAERPFDGPFARKARLVGTLVHTLLELLPGCPANRRADAAGKLVAARGRSLAESERERIVADVLGIVADPELAPLFGPKSRAEVTIAGRLPVGPGGAQAAVAGRIDRLAETEDSVFIADYKTSAIGPDSADDVRTEHLAQLAVYRALVAPLYPTKTVRCVLIYTARRICIEIPPERLDEAWTEVRPA